MLILRCDGRYGLRKRPPKGLLADMWEFPHISGKPDLNDVIVEVEGIGANPRNILRQVEKKHTFTHIEWDMNGIYMEVAEPIPELTWLTPEQIREETALPTAFRQFWEETDYV